MKRLIVLMLLSGILMCTCSCSLAKKPIENKTGFLKQLKQTEDSIRNEKWDKAKKNLDASIMTWKKIKPILQVEIDHDYINDIEDDFIRLGGYIDTKDKSDSLATILLIEDTWNNIGSL